MSAHVTVDGLSIVFTNEAGQDVRAIDNLSVSLPRGGTLGVVGESGSGKSTLARALLGFKRPGARFAAGRVQVGGTDVLSLTGQTLRTYRGARAALVPQNPLSSLTPHLTVGAQLAELTRLHMKVGRKAARARALELMRATDLPQPETLYDRYPHEISGGQRQRVVIAAALAGRPELIVLDEPTTALDKTVEARVLSLVERVHRELDATLVYVSHDLNVIARMCRTVLIMREGRMVETGDREEIFRQPRTAYARTLIAALPSLARRSPPRPAARERLLVVDGLRFAYGRRRPLGSSGATRRVVDDVSFSIGPGETLGLVGESGSGKSTIAALIAGILARHEGRMVLGDTIVTGAARRRPKELRRRIQLVFQDPLSSLNPSHRVGDIVMRPLQLYFGVSRAEARARTAELFASLELSEALLDRTPPELSGGQQQRVALGRALAANPEVLLCDEITSALDVTVQSRVLKILRERQAALGFACVFISHDLAVVADMSTKLLILKDGAVQDYGPREEVLADPSPYARRLLSAFMANERQPQPEPQLVGHQRTSSYLARFLSDQVDPT